MEQWCWAVLQDSQNQVEYLVFFLSHNFLNDFLISKYVSFLVEVITHSLNNFAMNMWKVALFPLFFYVHKIYSIEVLMKNIAT